MLEFHGPPQDDSRRAQALNQRRAAVGWGASVIHDRQGGMSPRDSIPSRRPRGRTPGPEVATLVQGRFKRDGNAEGKAEPGGSSDAAAQRAQESGPAAAVHDVDGSRDKDRGKGEGTGKAPSGPGSRIAMRNWRISTRLVSLLALPVVAATTLGALRIGDSLDNVDQLDNMKRLTEMTEQATALAAALQEERDRSAGPLVGTGNAKDDWVVAPREETDHAFQSFKEATGDIDGSDKVMAGVQSTVLDITRQLTDINDIRDRAYDNDAYVSQTVNSYNQLIESLLSLSQDMAQATSNPEMIQSTRALAAFSSAKEYASIQRAVISAGLARSGGPQLSESDRLYARTAADSEKAQLTSFSQIYGDEKASDLTKPLNGGNVNITTADKYRDRVLQNSGAIKEQYRSYPDWFDQDRSKIDEMAKIETSLLSQMEQQARELRSDAQGSAFLNGAIILLVLGISLVGAFVVARSMVRSLRRLQDTAQDVARERLPQLVRQMSEAEPQDVDTSVESVGVHTRDEIGRVAAAFDDVHREAVRLAGEQALLRGNVNAMFTNLSRRSQGLIQRQLSLISELESREADPDQLSSLFKLDHLATRMRRNGENLLVLAGEEPGRRWTRPVPLVDVLRAAASEVEQYERIELSSVPATEVTGRVVNDLVHLLAELLENATSFSSPQTKVKVTGHALPDGRVLVEIHDTGIGLSPEDLSSINERLANPPTVDVSVSRRMGLFVVGRLSLRHGIRIQLRPSDSGGTTALVMLPVEVAQGGASKGKPGAGPGGPGGGRPPKGSGLAAALQREPQGGSGAGAGMFGGGPPRGQVAGGGQRPALPGSGGEESGAGNLFGAPPVGRSGLGQGPSAPQPPSGPGGRTSPPLPSRGNPAELTGGGPSSGRQGPGDTGQFPAVPPQGGPGDTGRFPAVGGRPQQGGPERGRQDFGRTDEFAAPPQDGRTGHDPGQTGEFTRPSDTAQFPEVAPQRGPGDTGAFARPDAGERNAEQQRPSWAAGQPAPTEDLPRGHDEHEATGEYAQPGFTGASSGGAAGPGGTGQFPALPQRGEENAPRQQQHQEQQAHAAPEHGIPAVPPAPDDAPTPIFASMESNWFRSAGPSARASFPPQQTQAQQPPAQAPQQSADTPPRSPQAPTPRPDQPASAIPPQRQPVQGPPQDGSDTGSHWGASPNDERWRRAEQVRQPSAGGVTTSGLPRRVPRANLVAGTAQQQSSAQQSGPQVSRAPDDVRGRLTNLRRGIQQGRQAGTDGRGIGPTYQQER